MAANYSIWILENPFHTETLKHIYSGSFSSCSCAPQCHLLGYSCGMLWHDSNALRQNSLNKKQFCEKACALDTIQERSQANQKKKQHLKNTEAFSKKKRGMNFNQEHSMSTSNIHWKHTSDTAKKDTWESQQFSMSDYRARNTMPKYSLYLCPFNSALRRRKEFWIVKCLYQGSWGRLGKTIPFLAMINWSMAPLTIAVDAGISGTIRPVSPLLYSLVQCTRNCAIVRSITHGFALRPWGAEPDC